MHSVVVTVRPPVGESADDARRTLEERVIPGVRQSPGFVAAYWLAPPAEGGPGLSVSLYESEADAVAAASRVSPPPPVELVGVEVRAVIAAAQPGP